MPKRKRRPPSKQTGSTNKTGFYGVTLLGEKYQAMIYINGKTIHLGSTYATAEEAALVVDTEAIKLRRPLDKLNYPEKAPAGYTPLQQPLLSTNTIGYRGVSKNKEKETYIVRCRIYGKETYIGLYVTARDAAIAYDRAVLKANQSTTKLNFPDMVHNLDVEPKRIKHKLSSTGYRGVKKVSSGRFAARIKRKGIEESLGTFDTAIGAALAYDQAAIRKGNKKSTLNFPNDQKEQEKQKKQKKQKTEKKEKTEKKQKKQKKTKMKGVLTMQEYKAMLQASM